MSSKILQMCAFGPKIYTHLVGQGNSYSANVCESAGDVMLSLFGGVKNLCIVVSPVLLPYLLFRCQPENLLLTLKYVAVFYSIAWFLRTFGRVTNNEYRTFAALLLEAKDGQASLNLRNQLKSFDYECFASPPDFVAKKRSSKYYATHSDEPAMNQSLGEPWQSLRDLLAYASAHTFGRRMLYPGATAILKSMFTQSHVENRRKFVISQEAQRNILQTEDGNLIDTMFWDKRNKDERGNTLVIGFEGNAGYYEAGILVTPLSLKYSVLGFNIPGFGESTGSPYPSEILNSVEAVLQFATNKLGFAEENIVFYAWSIGGFPASWGAANYRNTKALVLDASFDDLVPLAVIRLPSMMSSLVNFTVRKYFDLSIAKYLAKYPGPVLLIRRWNDEIIVTDDSLDEQDRRASNRANDLLINFLSTRYPNLFQTDEDQQHVRTWLSIDPPARLLSFSASEPEIPKNVSGLERAQRQILIEQLCNKHFVDFEASHNVPLDPLYFNIPSAVTYEDPTQAPLKGWMKENNDTSK